MPTASSLAWKTSLRKVRTLWHCSRLRSVALYLWLIVVISVRQSTVAAISGLHCRALVMVSSSIRLTAWLQNSKKRAERSERLMYEQSHRDYPCSGYPHHRLLVSGPLIITVITPLPTKPSATKMPENWKLANAAITDMQMRQRDVAALDAKYTQLADAKAENDALRDGRCRWSSSVVLSCQAFVSQCVKPPPPSGVDTMQPPPTGRHCWTGLFLPSERGWSLCKQLEGTQKHINEQCADRAGSYRWATHAIIVSNTHAPSGV